MKITLDTPGLHHLMIVLANDANIGIEHGSDFPSGSLQGNTSALDCLSKPLDRLHGNGLSCKIIPDCTPCFIRQHYHNVVVPRTSFWGTLNIFGCG